MRMHRLFIPLILLSINACTASGDPSSVQAEGENYRVIVGFHAGEAAPEHQQVVDQLQAALDGRVEYLHDLSGNAAVYRVTTPLDRQALVSRLTELNGHPPIRYAELDERRHIQSPTTGPGK